jgi:hypothetical protein
VGIFDDTIGPRSACNRTRAAIADLMQTPDAGMARVLDGGEPHPRGGVSMDPFWGFVDQSDLAEEARTLDPNIALDTVGSLSSQFNLYVLPQRAAAWCVGAFGLLGLGHAALGWPWDSACLRGDFLTAVARAIRSL